jgi:hypothetical protein
MLIGFPLNLVFRSYTNICGHRLMYDSKCNGHCLNKVSLLTLFLIPLGRPRHRWEDGIRMDLREIGWGELDWIQLAQDRTGGGLL